MQNFNYEKIFLSPHSHVDITWWDKPQVCKERIYLIIDEVIELVKKYPHYEFSLETTAPIYFYLQQFPDKENEIKKIIKNKNLEIGGLFVSLITDICVEEVLIRNLYFGKKYLQQTLNYDVNFVKEEDVPGHTYQFPQILNSAGIKYLKISRGPQGLFWWLAKDNSKVLTCLIDYGGIAQKRQKTTASILRTVNRFLNKSQNKDKINYPFIYLPVGDDMEVPTEKIIKAVDKWNAKIYKPKIILANFNKFMQNVENFSHKKIKGDIPNIWTGLVTMETAIIQTSLTAQRTLIAAEKFNTFAFGQNEETTVKKIKDSYENILLISDHNWGARDKNHFSVECDEYKENLARETKKESEEILKNSLEEICKKINFKQKGIPVVVFNSLNCERDDVVEVNYELRITNYELKNCNTKISSNRPSGLLNDNNYVLYDNKGNIIPFQFENNKLVFVAEKVPPLGYKTYYLLEKSEVVGVGLAPTQKKGTEEVIPAQQSTKGVIASKEQSQINSHLKIKNNIIESNFYKVELSPAGIKKLYYKEIKKDLAKNENLIKKVSPELVSGILQGVLKLKLPKIVLNTLTVLILFLKTILSLVIKLKFNTGELWAITARFKAAPEGFYEQENVEGVGEEVEIGKEFFKSAKCKDKIFAGKNGAVRKSIISKSKFIDESEKETEIVLYEKLKRIDYNVTLNWKGREKTMISIAFPLNIKDAQTTIDLPFGTYKLGEEAKGFWDNPENIAGFKLRGIQDFIDINNKEYGVTLSSSTPCFDFTFFPSCNLIYSDNQSAFFYGDYYRKIGVHKFNFSFYPYKKNTEKTKTWQKGKFLNHPLQAIIFEDEKQNLNTKTLADELSFCKTSSNNVVINCVKKSEEDESLIIRFYEIQGKEEEIKINFGFDILSAHLCDVLENEIEKLPIEKNIAKIKVLPYKIYTIKILI